jgi:hypothetical protein
MLKKLVMLLGIAFLTSAAHAQGASGYLGKLFSVSAGFGCYPFVILNPVTHNEFYAEYPGLQVASRWYINAEYAIAEYVGLGLDFSLHKNIIPVSFPIQGGGNYERLTIPLGVKCKSINPVFRFYKKSMTPAPVGNFVGLGLNFTMVNVDSAKYIMDVYDNGAFSNNKFYQKDGKMAFPDLSIAFGRTFLIGGKVLLRAEMGIPYFFNSIIASAEFDDKARVYLDEMDNYPKAFNAGVRKKIALNNLFLYTLVLGLPF